MRSSARPWGLRAEFRFRDGHDRDPVPADLLAAAFSFVFLEWKGRDLILSIMLATLIIPFETIAIPLLLMVSQLPWIGFEGFEIGWLNTYRVQIIPWIADGLTIFLFVQYFKDLPRELIEASRVEGASWWQIYRQGRHAALGSGDRHRRDPEIPGDVQPVPLATDGGAGGGVRPVMVGLGYFFQLNTAWGEVMAYLTAHHRPGARFYLVLQRAFIASIASTGVKG
jgi:multiple sugar transport system permease protein